MNILFYRYNSIFEPDCLVAFKDFGITVDELNIAKMQGASKEDLLKKLGNMIIDQKTKEPYLFVFSINFFPEVSDLCEKLGIIYACWSVDSPVNELLFRQVLNKVNRLFLFDYAQYERISKYNKAGVFYLPLATNTTRLKNTVDTITDADIKKYSSDITFIGSLYNEKNPMKSVEIDEYSRGFIDGIIESQKKIYGCNFIEKAIDDRIVKALKKDDLNYDSTATIEPIDRYIAAHSYIGVELAERERIETLNSLAQRFSVNLYTNSDTSMLKNVNNLGPANTLTQMPKIFNLSKINLNITMRPIQTGLSLRVYDVLGSGGFLITNYQAELPSLYEPGVDLETYSSMDELIEKCDYYLHHEEERQAIAINGYNKTVESHNIHIRIKTMFEYMLGDK